MDLRIVMWGPPTLMHLARTISTEQPLAPYEALAVRAHGALERQPGDPDAKEEREGKQGSLRGTAVRLRLKGEGACKRRTKRALARALTGADAVKMILRRRVVSGLFSHSRSVTSSCAWCTRVSGQ